MSRFEAHITLGHRSSSLDSGSGSAGGGLWIFVGPEDLCRLAGPVVSSDEARSLFDRWRAAVPADRRCGTVERPTVGVVVDGVPWP